MTDTPPSSASVGRYVPHLGLMLLVQSLTSVSAAAIPVLAPVIAAHAGVAATNIGIFTVVLYGCGMASAMVGGAMVPRFGAARVCQLALLFCAAGLVLALSGHVVGLLLCALVLGCGMGAPTPASSHLLGRVTPPRLLSLVFSIKQTGVPLGGAIAGATLPVLTLQFGWRGALLAAALTGAVVVMAIQPWRPALDHDRDPARRVSLPGVWGTLGLIWRDSDLRLLGIAAAVLSAGQVCVSAFFVTWLVQSIGLLLTTAGFALATAQMSGVAGRIVWGAVADWTRRPLLVFAGLAAVSAAAMLVASGFEAGAPIWAIYAVAAILGTTTIGWAGVAYAEVARRAPPGRAAEASGGVTSVMFAGIVIGPAIFGIIVRLTGSYTPAFLMIAAALAAIAAALILRLLRGGAR